MRKRVARELLDRLNRDAERIAHRFGLRYRAIEAERANVKQRYGICYDDGLIRIRLFHVVTGRPLKYSSLVNTLCHELAHLRHMNHGRRFRALYQQILEYARREGLYRPGTPELRPVCKPPRQAPPRPAAPTAPAGPVQLTLFG